MFESLGSLFRSLLSGGRSRPEEDQDKELGKDTCPSRLDELEHRMNTALARGQAHTAASKIALEDFRKEHTTEACVGQAEGAHTHLDLPAPKAPRPPAQKKTTFSLDVSQYEELRTKRLRRGRLTTDL